MGMARRRRIPVTDPTKAVAYIRVSKDTQELSPEAQRAGIERWAAQYGIQVTSWHVDAGVHGDSPCSSRPGLGAALEALGGAGLLVALRRDRVGRDSYETAGLERALAGQGVRLVTCDASNDDSPEAALMRHMLDGFAAFELAQIRRRTREALAAKRARGEVSGTIPYGYRLSSDGRHLEEHPEEQAVVVQARSLRASGLPVRAVMRKLAASGVVSRGGHPLGLAQVHSLLRRAA